MQFVFAYGSIVSELDGIPSRVASLHGFIADLSGFRRSWTVAMNNWEDIPGYKYYVSPGPPHERPELAVAFLNVEQHRDGVVNGVCRPVTEAGLSNYDARERNYVRRDVTDRIRPRPPGRVWAYVATDDARARATRARGDGRLVVQRRYVEEVEESFRKLGEDELARYRASTDDPDVPIKDLLRRELE